jgi:hypothetical protein
VRERASAEWLVRLYPPSFRDAVGADLADALVDRMRARREDGACVAMILLHALADTARTRPAPGATRSPTRSAIAAWPHHDPTTESER